MRTTILAAAAATLLLTFPSLAEPESLQAPVHGTMTTRAWGDVRVVTKYDGRQVVEFENNFQVTREPGAEVRLVESSGRVTTLGLLKSEEGKQSYAVPENITIGEQDNIVIYSPSYDEDLATVDFLEE